MQGFRTLAFNILAAVGAVAGIQTAPLPPSWQAWMTVGAAAWGVIAIGLRAITTTPIGKKVEADIEKDLGFSDTQMQQLVDLLPPKDDLVTAIAAVKQLQVAAAPLLAPLTPPATATSAGSNVPNPQTTGATNAS
jgi:hypothetical protein